MDPALRSYLATLSTPALARHLEVRPDVLVGAPVRDLDDLAQRLTDPSGIAASLAGAPLPALQVLEVLAASGAGARAVRARARRAPRACWTHGAPPGHMPTRSVGSWPISGSGCWSGRPTTTAWS